MPVPNTRVVVLGTPAADKEFTVVERDRETAQRLAEAAAKDAEQLRREVRRAFGPLARRGR